MDKQTKDQGWQDGQRRQSGWTQAGEEHTAATWSSITGSSQLGTRSLARRNLPPASLPKAPSPWRVAVGGIEPHWAPSPASIYLVGLSPAHFLLLHTSRLSRADRGPVSCWVPSPSGRASPSMLTPPRWGRSVPHRAPQSKVPARLHHSRGYSANPGGLGDAGRACRQLSRLSLGP